MKKIMAIISLVLTSSVAFANDGGIAAIKVDQIKMRETAIKDGKEVVVKKIATPHFKITIEGGEAKKLQQILPSQVSVITSMYPEIAKDFKESFKTLGIYSEASKAASGKGITISCSDATLNDEGNKVIKTGKSVCTISIEGYAKDESPADSFGDLQPFEPKSCQ